MSLYIPVQRSPKQSTRTQGYFEGMPTEQYASDPGLNTSTFKNIESESNKRHKKSFRDFTQGFATTLGEIRAMFMEIKSQQDQKYNALHESMSKIVNQNEDIHKSVEFMSSKYDELLEKVPQLEQINSNKLIAKQTDHHSRTKN
ncbi:unnamed protein product [Leptidea sinapis]|uniref:Uncharacterized protein n=1 Tax=Leptidea sinapis TaxID=189913 RepID=A0A5E4PLP6_9NEOP|nr:unnamed protein product [Leptidea sinapis]